MPRPSARAILVAAASMLGPWVAAQDREPARVAPGGEVRPVRVLVRGQTVRLVALEDGRLAATWALVDAVDTANISVIDD